MKSQIEAIYDQAGSRYLNPEELTIIGQYVKSLPERLETYRIVRDQELTMMQRVADCLQAELPEARVEHLEHSLKTGLLILRYCAMGMLLNDEVFVQERLLKWLHESALMHNLSAIDAVLYRSLTQQLNQTLTVPQMDLLNPLLRLAQNTLLEEEGMLTVAGIF